MWALICWIGWHLGSSRKLCIRNTVHKTARHQKVQWKTCNSAAAAVNTKVLHRKLPRDLRTASRSEMHFEINIHLLFGGKRNLNIS